MPLKHPTRRRFLFAAGKFTLAGVATVSGLSLLSGCGGGNESDASTKANEDCSDLTGLTAAQIEVRDTYDYVDSSSEPDEYCNNCEYWEPAPEGRTCGGCTLMAGPIEPLGWCSAWEPAETG